MKVVKIGIVEDEAIIADSIIETLHSMGYETTEPCMTYTAALEMVEQEKPDLVLLDIQLAGKKTGIDVAEVLNKDYNIPFIFLTSNADAKTVADAKKVNPYAYLVKPFNKEDLFTSIEIALSNFESNFKQLTNTTQKLTNVIFVKKKDRFYSIKLEEILFIKNDHVYIEIYTQNDTFLIRSSLESFVEQLPKTIFFQIHRSYVINLNYLETINSDTVSIKGHEIPMSKTNRIELMKIANIF